MRFLRRSLVGIFLFSLTLAILAYAGRTIMGAVDARVNAAAPAFPQRERVTSVNVLTYRSTSIAPDLVVFGELRSRRTLGLRPSVGGTVTEVAQEFVVGGSVTAGQFLLRIDPVEAEAILARAEADLQDAEAQLRDAERSLALSLDTQAGAEAQAALREQALQRQRDLQTRGVGTAPDLEAAELAASAANQTVLSARQSVAQAQARIDQGTTLIARQRINVAEARRNLADTEVFAAFDGVLANVSVTPGGRVTANEPIGELIDPAALEVSFRLSTFQHAQLRGDDGDFTGTPVTVTLDVAGVSLSAEGRITREAASVGEGQTGRLVFADVDAAAGLRPGDFVTVKVQEPPIENVALLPATAVAADNTVLVVNAENRLEVAGVELLRRQGDDVIVRGDLEGAVIVAERSPLLGAGILVRPIARDGSAAAAPEAEMIELSDERRARLRAFVEGSNSMPDEAKTRILAQLEQDRVPSDMVAQLESRMGS
jgi:membrane fusion protein, multidrug efflux system